MDKEVKDSGGDVVSWEIQEQGDPPVSQDLVPPAADDDTSTRVNHPTTVNLLYFTGELIAIIVLALLGYVVVSVLVDTAGKF